MSAQTTTNILHRKKRGDILAVQERLQEHGTPIPRWKISQFFNGIGLDDPDAELVLTTLASVVAARELAAKQNLQKAEDVYQKYMQIFSP